MVAELALTPLKLLVTAAKALRAMDAARRISLLLTAGLVASLFAPWFVHTTVAHGLTGPRRLTESFTGWDALPAAAFACLGVAALAWLLLFVRAAVVVDGLGAQGRRAARARVDGGLICLLGLLAVAWLAAALVSHPGSTSPAVGATTTVGVRWGVALALVLALALAGVGLLIVRSATRTQVLAATRAGADAPEAVDHELDAREARAARDARRARRAQAASATQTAPVARTTPVARTAPVARTTPVADPAAVPAPLIIARSVPDAEPAPPTVTDRDDGATRAAPWPRRRARPPRSRRETAAVPERAPDPAMPDFDFTVSDEPVPSTPGTAERRAAGQPRGRKSGPEPGTFSRSAP